MPQAIQLQLNRNKFVEDKLIRSLPDEQESGSEINPTMKFLKAPRSGDGKVEVAGHWSDAKLPVP